MEVDRHDIQPFSLKKDVDCAAKNIRGRNIGHVVTRVASARGVRLLTPSKLTELDLSLRDDYGNTAASYLSSRQSINSANGDSVRRLPNRTCHPSKSFAGPAPLQRPSSILDDLEAQDGRHIHFLELFPSPFDCSTINKT